MVWNYKEICRHYDIKVKIFTQMPGDMKNMIGSPDLLVLFTNTVSHKMIHNAIKSGEKSGAKIIRSHSSSSCALNRILSNYCAEENCDQCPNNSDFSSPIKQRNRNAKIR